MPQKGPIFSTPMPIDSRGVEIIMIYKACELFSILKKVNSLSRSLKLFEITESVVLKDDNISCTSRSSLPFLSRQIFPCLDWYAMSSFFR